MRRSVRFSEESFSVISGSHLFILWILWMFFGGFCGFSISSHRHFSFQASGIHPQLFLLLSYALFSFTWLMATYWIKGLRVLSFFYFFLHGFSTVFVLKSNFYDFGVHYRLMLPGIIQLSYFGYIWSFCLNHSFQKVLKLRTVFALLFIFVLLLISLVFYI